MNSKFKKILYKIVPNFYCFNNNDNIDLDINQTIELNKMLEYSLFNNIKSYISNIFITQPMSIEHTEKEYKVIKFMKMTVQHHKLLTYYINNYSNHIITKCKNMKYSIIIDMMGYNIPTNHIKQFIQYFNFIPLNSDLYNLSNFIYRCCKYNITLFSTYNLALLYLERFFSKCNIHIANLLNEYNFYIFFSLALIISIKYNDDEPYNSYSLSFISGIPLHLFNKLEKLFLQILDYNLYYQIHEFNHIQNIIEFDTK